MKTIHTVLLTQFLTRKSLKTEVKTFLGYTKAVRKNGVALMISITAWAIALPLVFFLLASKVYTPGQRFITTLALACFSLTFVPVLIEERRLTYLRAIDTTLAMELAEFDSLREMFRSHYRAESFGRMNTVREKFLYIAKLSLPPLTQTAKVKSWRDLPVENLSSLYLLHSVGKAFVELEDFSYLLDSLESKT